MKATLIYNDHARSTHKVSAESLQDALREAGFEPVYRPTRQEKDLEMVLADVDGGLVVAAGGDGTVRAVATRLLNRDVALTLLPLGTANNIARTFSVEGDPHRIIQAIAKPFKCNFDVGRVRTPWGEHYFLEAMGFGFYADTLAKYGPEKPKNVLRAIGAFTKTIPDYQAKPYHIVLDGKEISDHYLLVEVLNTTAFGPRLKVAPNADTGDGLFEVIRIHAEQRESFIHYVRSVFAEELDTLPSVEASQVSQMEIAWKGFPLHIDGEVHPKIVDRPSARRHLEDPKNVKILVDVIPQALEFWLPQEPKPHLRR